MKLWIIYPCFNNYDLLIGENKDFILSNRDRILIIDDHSSVSEFEKGNKWCQENGIKFILNPGKGVPEAVEHVVSDHSKENDWLLIMQQDVCFVDKDAINKLENRLKTIANKGYRIGAVGFPNFVSSSHYHEDTVDLTSVHWNHCWLGLFTLSKSDYYKAPGLAGYVFRFISKFPYINSIYRKFWHKVIFHRNFAPLTYPQYEDVVANYKGLCAVELPVWTSVAINSNAWRQSVQLDSQFVFHLWFPDIANQLMNENWYVCNDTEFVVHNNWQVKFNYNQLGSVEEGKKQGGKMEAYGSHLTIWRNKWGYDYEDPFPSQLNNLKIKKGSVLELMINHNPKYPLKIFSIN